MADQFRNVTLTGTDYVAGATIEKVLNGNGGYFDVSGGNVFYQLEFPDPVPGMPRSGYGNARWGTEFPLGTGPGTIPPGCTGVRFRNQSATTPATVTAAIAGAAEPILSTSAPGTISTTLNNNTAAIGTDVAQSIPNGVNTAVVFTGGGVIYDTNGYADLANNRLVVPASLAGSYVVAAGALWAGSAVGFRDLTVQRNGSLIWQNDVPANATGAAPGQNAEVPVALAAGDRLTLQVFQTSGGPLNLNNVRLWLFRVA